jgi:hypothetical protein
MSKATLVLVCMVGCSGAAQGAITLYAGQDVRFVADATADFNSGPLGGGGTYVNNLDEAGMNFRGVNNKDVPDEFWGYPFPGGDGTPSLYFNGGDTDVLGITRLDGADFDTIEMQVGAGWGGPTVYLWVQAFEDGVQVASFDHDAQYGDYIGVTGGGFDELRIGGYNTAEDRNLHQETTYQALAVDNVSTGTIDTGNNCYADLNGDTVLDLFDFLEFTNLFNAGDDLANCDGQGGLDLFDFLCYTNEFNAGC